MKNIVSLTGVLFLLVITALGAGLMTHVESARADPGCPVTPIQSISQMLFLTSQNQWLNYLEGLTGEKSVMISGSPHMIKTRHTPKLFDGSEDALAIQYIKEQLDGMHYPPNTSADHFGYYENQYTSYGRTWKNLILTTPGLDQVDPKELIISAHLDSLPDGIAPGAEDDGTGAAALLEMARVLRYYQFDATIKLIWFTGEEQGLLGSNDYVLDNFPFFEDLIGVINLDMFGYDNDDDNCFEIHAGELPASYVLGNCLINTIRAYTLPLTFDYIQEEVPSAVSDHRSFWLHDIGAIEILENHFGRQTADSYHQCGDSIDANPNNHTINDTIGNSINATHAFSVIRASLAASATISGPMGVCFQNQPIVTASLSIPYVRLDWQNMGDYVTYLLSRSLNGCEGPWQELSDNIYDSEYTDRPVPSQNLAYQVEAIAPSGMCISLPSNCVTDIGLSSMFFPFISK